MIPPSIPALLASARRDGRSFLLESEGFALLAALGFEVPFHTILDSPENLAELDLALFPGDHVVLKVVSPDIQHKSDVGGIAVVPRDPDAVRAELAAMESRLAALASGVRRGGYLVCTHVDFARSLGHEMLLGLRWTDELGAVAVFGAGGIHTEVLSGLLREDRSLAIVSPAIGPPNETIPRALRDAAITPLLAEGLRGHPPVLPLPALVAAVRRLFDLAPLLPTEIAEIEINPLVVSPGSDDSRNRSAASERRGRLQEPRLVALDVLVRLGRPARTGAPPRPLAKIARLLQPHSIALAGVSATQRNPGRVILDNLLAGGFDRARLYVLRADAQEIAGVHCVPGPAQLPEKVDLAVLSVAAQALPGMITEFVETERAESLIVIPGGLEEKSGSEEIVARMRSALAEARTKEWGGPVINGGNCLGIQSAPGGYDTLFIPRHKLPVPQGEAAPLALLCQSGAHMVANLDRLGGVVPRYAISVGNQTDLTVGDYLTFLEADPEVRVFACYVEGFRPLDGLAFFQAAERITARGRTVLLYLAGRTPAGAQASASHTASLAGDHTVLRAAARQAGVVLAKNLANFADLLQLFVLLGNRKVRGTQLGAISNAGFECVAFADAASALRLATFTPATVLRLQEILASAHIDAIVDVHNPLDLTPMAGDAAYAEAVATILADDGVDVGVVGIVPLTPALQTLEPAPEHGEDLRDPSAIAARLATLAAKGPKPWVAVVDGGRRADPFARELEARGIPTFRTADRAVRLLEVFVRERLRAARDGRG